MSNRNILYLGIGIIITIIIIILLININNLINNYDSNLIILGIIILLIIIGSRLSNIKFNDIKRNKKMIGQSRWAYDYEMKSKLKKQKIDSSIYNGAGIPLISNGKTAWVDDSENHTLIVGATGSGKTRRLINPLVKILGQKGESIIITDPKEELYQETSGMLKEKGYHVIVLNFRNPLESDAWNPLTIPYQYYKEGNIDKAEEYLEDLSCNIFYTDAFNRNAFLEESAAEYFCGLALYLFEDGTEEEINLNSIANMLVIGETSNGNTSYMEEYVNLKGSKHPGYMYVSSTLHASEEMKNNILFLFKQKIRVFTSRERLSDILATNSFDIRKIGNEKTVIYLIIHDEKVTYHALASLFVKQCYEVLVAHNQKLPIRLNFVLDEFGNMPSIKDFTNIITASRSRNIRFYLIIQNFSQLDMIYKYEPAEAIKSNCANIIYLLSSEMKVLEFISKVSGEKIKRDEDGKIVEKEPLITVSDLQRMRMGDVIVIKQRMYPFKTKLPDQSNYCFHNNINSIVKKGSGEYIKEVFDLINYISQIKNQDL